MENSSFSDFCSFDGFKKLDDLTQLIFNSNCYRHSLGFSLFLFLGNVLILLFGFAGNSLVIYVVICKIKTKTASSLFILNLAVADLFVIVGCIPATLVSNLFVRKLEELHKAFNISESTRIS